MAAPQPDTGPRPPEEELGIWHSSPHRDLPPSRAMKCTALGRHFIFSPFSQSSQRLAEEPSHGTVTDPRNPRHPRAAVWGKGLRGRAPHPLGPSAPESRSLSHNSRPLGTASYPGGALPPTPRALDSAAPRPGKACLGTALFSREPRQRTFLSSNRARSLKPARGAPL